MAGDELVKGDRGLAGKGELQVEGEDAGRVFPEVELEGDLKVKRDLDWAGEYART